MSNAKRRRAVRPLRLSILVLALCSTASAWADSGETTWTTYLYEGPGSHYVVVDEVPQAQALEVLGCAKGWCHVSYGGRAGYVEADVVVHGSDNPVNPPAGVLAQPAAALESTPKGPCFTANQKGGNGGNALTLFCAK